MKLAEHPNWEGLKREVNERHAGPSARGEEEAIRLWNQKQEQDDGKD